MRGLRVARARRGRGCEGDGRRRRGGAREPREPRERGSAYFLVTPPTACVGERRARGVCVVCDSGGRSWCAPWALDDTFGRRDLKKCPRARD